MTKYAIKHNGLYFMGGASGYHWTENMNEAALFNNMTSAIAAATTHLELSPHEYSVEAIAN